MAEKEFTNYNQQIELLKSRGVIINKEDENYAKEVLQNIGYYSLINGYKRPFLIISQTENEKFKPNTTIQEIHTLYEFDRVLREIFMDYILKVEIHVKSIISYYFSEVYGHDNYLKYTNFDTEKRGANDQIPALISEIQRQIAAHTKDPCISHYLINHGYIPLWVLNNILTFGTVSKFYSLMKTSEKTKAARVFMVQPHDLENFLMHLSSIRNFCAHATAYFAANQKENN